MRRNIVFTGLCVTILMAPFPGFSAELNIDTSSPFLYQKHSKKISMDFQDAALVDVLKIFSQQTELNLITSENLATRRITVFLDKVPVEAALDQVLRANNLTYELQPDSDIYIVKPLSKPEVELITRVYNLKNASVKTSKILSTLAISTGDEQTAGSSISSSTDAGIIAAVEAILTQEGSITEDPRTNSLIVTDIASNFNKIEATIARLDTPAVQVLIEVEMLEVTKKTADLMGIKAGDTPLEFTGAQRQHLYPWDQNRLLDTPELDLEIPNYTVGTINAIGLTATLQFLRTQTDTKSLARPRILTLNNESAQIKISTDEAIGVTTETTAAEGVGSSSVEAERVETGVFLTVTPQANVGTGEITMAVVPRVIVARTGATFDGTTFRDPEERGSQSILRVMSGETIIIGGLIREEFSKTLTKVPILGDIPFIGGAFRHKDESVTEKELIIFITPHITHILANQLPTPRLTAEKQRAIFREQDMPLNRLDKVKKELSNIQN